MSRICEVCGDKRTRFGGSIARRGLPKRVGGIGLRTTGHTKRTFKPNIQRVRALVGSEVRRVKVCMRCLKAGKIQKPRLSRTG